MHGNALKMLCVILLLDVYVKCKHSNGSAVNEKLVHVNAELLLNNTGTCEQSVKHVKNDTCGDNIITSSELTVHFES